MLDCILDGVIDTLKLLPYLFVTFLLLEFIEHKLSKKNEKILVKNRKFGPVLGGLLGALPQCGFSSMAASLFSGRVITIGTLIAVFLSTSDEMLPIMISEKVNPLLILKIIGFKVIIGIIIGFIIDIFYSNKTFYKKDEIKNMCEDEHCCCNHSNIFISGLKHTLKISLFILIINLIIGLIIFKVGEDNLSNLLVHKNLLGYFISSLVGLIPNCAGSVAITEVYLANLISVGTMISGLLTGSGLGILLLFKTNKNLKENIFILTSIYFIGIIIGFIVDLFI